MVIILPPPPPPARMIVLRGLGEMGRAGSEKVHDKGMLKIKYELKMTGFHRLGRLPGLSNFLPECSNCYRQTRQTDRQTDIGLHTHTYTARARAPYLIRH